MHFINLPIAAQKILGEQKVIVESISAFVPISKVSEYILDYISKVSDSL